MKKTTWSENLKFLRKKMGKSQSDIGFMLNRGQAIIANWERGKTDPNIMDLIAIKTILGISIDELLTVPLWENANLNRELTALDIKPKAGKNAKATANLFGSEILVTLYSNLLKDYVERRDRGEIAMDFDMERAAEMLNTMGESPAMVLPMPFVQEMLQDLLQLRDRVEKLEAANTSNSVQTEDENQKNTF